MGSYGERKAATAWNALCVATSAFETALNAHLAAISARDIVAFSETVSCDAYARVIGPDGTATIGYEAIVAAHRGWFESGAAWTFEPSIVLCRSSEALGFALLEVAYLEGTAQRRFLLSLIFTREAGVWKLFYDQNTPLPIASVTGESAHAGSKQ